jgi:hypothetical protein
MSCSSRGCAQPSARFGAWVRRRTLVMKATVQSRSCGSSGNTCQRSYTRRSRPPSPSNAVRSVAVRCQGSGSLHLGPGGAEEVVLFERRRGALQRIRSLGGAHFVRLHGRYGFT